MKLITKSMVMICNLYEVELDPQETVVAEAGSFMMMDGNVMIWKQFLAMASSSGGSGLMGKAVRCRKTIDNW